jgi:CheY-like chemotaxis protein
MTGHLVLATVHANDAVSAVPRLADLGLQYGTIATTLRGAMAQRLLRKVCPSCAEEIGGGLTPEEERLRDRFGVEPRVRAVGCSDCGFSGFRGRLPVMEVMSCDSRVAAAIEARKGTTTLTRLAEQGGMRSMGEVALEWVLSSQTTLEEVERVLGQVLEEVEREEKERAIPRVLLVDEDEEARSGARALLEEEGYEIHEAGDGPEALDKLKLDPRFSLIVVETAMKAMEGRDFLDLIRGSADTAALPVLVRTAAGSPEEEAGLLNAGADDYLSKTAGGDRFRARVKALIRRSLL